MCRCSVNVQGSYSVSVQTDLSACAVSLPTVRYETPHMAVSATKTECSDRQPSPYSIHLRIHIHASSVVRVGWESDCSDWSANKRGAG